MAACFMFRLYACMREHSARTGIALREHGGHVGADTEGLYAAAGPATILQANANFMAHSSFLKAEMTSLLLLQLSHAILAVRTIEFFAGPASVPQCFVMVELLLVFGLMALWVSLYMQFACLVLHGDSTWRAYAILESATHLALSLFRCMDRWPLLKIEYMLVLLMFGTPVVLTCLTCVALLVRCGESSNAPAPRACAAR